jgi:hypothetical protein
MVKLKKKEMAIIEEGGNIVIKVIDHAMNELKEKGKENLQKPMSIFIIGELIGSFSRKEERIEILETLLSNEKKKRG